MNGVAWFVCGVCAALVAGLAYGLCVVSARAKPWWETTIEELGELPTSDVAERIDRDQPE